MDNSQTLLDRILERLAAIKLGVIDFFRTFSFLDSFSDNTIEWIIICFIFVFAIVIIIPLLKWSFKVSIFAAFFAGLAALLTTASFWSLLPFTGLGVALFSFANRHNGD